MGIIIGIPNVTGNGGTSKYEKKYNVTIKNDSIYDLRVQPRTENGYIDPMYGILISPGSSTDLYGVDIMCINSQGGIIRHMYSGNDYKLIGYMFSYYIVQALSDLYLIVYVECFAKGTLITLADKTKKPIEELTYNDDILVWNFDEGKFDSAKPCWITKSGLTNDHYYKLTFSDGTELKTTGARSNHKLYSLDDKYFKGVNIIEIGERIFSEKGEVTVKSKEYIEEEVEYYNMMTSQHFNCFINGILSSDRYSNMYDKTEDMKYIKDDRNIVPYSVFESLNISKYWYDNLRLGEQNYTPEEIKKYIIKLEGIWNKNN